MSARRGCQTRATPSSWRTIPIAKIQNVHRRRGPLERLLRVTTLRIETAGGGEGDARLEVVSLRAADGLQTAILERRRRDQVEEAEPPWDLVRASPPAEILLAGATGSRLGVLVAGLFGAVELADDLGIVSRLPGKEAVSTWASSENGLLMGIVVATGIALLAWLVSIGFAFLTWFGFTLRRAGGDLRAQHGLLTREDVAIPLGRVQVLRLEANPLRRLLERTVVRAETAGSAKEHEGAGTTMLGPLLPVLEAPAFVRVVFPDFDLATLRLQRMHPLARRRGFVRALLGLAPLGAFVVSWLSVPPLFVLPLGGAVALGLAFARYRALGYAIEGRFLVARAGVWTRRLWVAPLSKVQEVFLRQSPMQRWLGLASLEVGTAGGGAFGSLRLIDLAAATARELRDRLSAAAAASGDARAGV